MHTEEWGALGLGDLAGPREGEEAAEGRIWFKVFLIILLTI
jgi:hypothetical protein